MVRSPKLIAIAISTLIVLIASFVVIGFYRDNQPAILGESIGESTIHIEAMRHAILFPGECLQVSWEINGIDAVYIMKSNRQLGTTGADSTIYCIWQENPRLRIDFPDGSSEIFTLEIQHLYRSPLIALLSLLTLIAISTIVYFTIGIPSVLAVLTIASFIPIFSINANIELDFQIHLSWVQSAIASGNYQNMPVHFIFHYSVILLQNIFPSMSMLHVAICVVILAQAGTVLGFYALFRKSVV